MNDSVEAVGSTGLEIAIIGMACRVPGAKNIDEFWHNLRNGVESITFPTREELESEGVNPLLLANPNYVKARASLDGIELFDASFFGFTPKEAEMLDPQQRVFLECAWEALENAGYDAETYSGAIGVYAGAAKNMHLHSIVSSMNSLEPGEVYQFNLANDRDFMPTRVSYKLNLQGPSLNVQTACSTSLVAVHLACQGLLNGECDIALAGGVSISVPKRCGYIYQEGMIHSPDGHCRAFDAEARGMVGGDGLGIVILKRLEDALVDCDSIYAVIKGSAVNNDGSHKIGYTAPSVDGQAKVIRAAQSVAEVNPETITYVEAHGTATELGDPIEIAALTKAFHARTTKKGFCAIGSVKTNIGHLNTAAGVAGLIKTALALKNKLIPPSLNFKHPNPKIDFANSPFYVNAKLAEWMKGPTPRRAGVSSFGIGGTNAHVVLEEAPEMKSDAPTRRAQLLVLSAKTTTALEVASRNLANHLREHPQLELADVAYTLQVGRRRFNHRRAVVCNDINDAVAVLESPQSKRMITEHRERQDASVAFMFPGQGAQYVDMGRSLYETEPIFRASLDDCAEFLKPQIGLDLRTILYPEPSQTVIAERKITETLIAQPALFVVEYALSQLWLEWGIEPQAVIGHSLGEYTAACVCGVLSRDDALRLVAGRAKLMQQLPQGAMLAVRLPAKEVEPLLSAPLSLAAVNAPSLTVVSGPHKAIQALQSRLEERHVGARKVSTSHAFHSEMMDAILELFAELVAKVNLGSPRIPWISCLTGDWITSAQATDPNYWTRQLREPVRFADAVQKLFLDPHRILLEVGPGTTLSTFAKQCPNKSADHIELTSFQQRHDAFGETQSLLQSLGRLWIGGKQVAWPRVQGGGQRQRLNLPAYPFERKRFWIEPPATKSVQNEHAPVAKGVDVPSKRLDSRNETGETDMAGASMVSNTTSDHQEEIRSKLRTLFADLSGIEGAKLDVSANFMELGFDSLFLTQVATAVQKAFGLKVSFRQLIEEHSTIESLTDYLARMTAPDHSAGDRLSQAAVSQGEFKEVAAGESVPPTLGLPKRLEPLTLSSETMERIVSKQLEIMSRQLELLRNGSVVPSSVTAVTADQKGHTSRHSKILSTFPAANATSLGEKTTFEVEGSDVSAFGPYKAIKKGSQENLTREQRKRLDELLDRYGKRTKESKRYTEAHRPHLADPRSVTGFRLLWKETTYPIVVSRSSGCRLWDIDGNQYVDLVSGFGSSLFGYAPRFIKDAVAAQLEAGIEIGPQSPLAGEVANLICELTGMERTAFCNTGSEAVMAALRVARTVTGRDKIALFSGSYHGIFDEVLVRSTRINGVAKPIPVAPGIAGNMLENVIVLEYDSGRSLELLRETSQDLAAVLVEPVQSRRPELQPKQFLHDLRELTAASGTALIFDEMVTGFRSCPGGAQALFGVKADLATYGKVVGGGLPIGIVAGQGRFMDALDGGKWSYGDDSFPEIGVTFFAGTFVRHPLALAAARAVLRHLKDTGPSLQSRLNDRTAEFVATLNAYAKQVDAPIHLTHFSSWFCINLSHELPMSSLFFIYMREKGVHVWEGRPCFLTTAHTIADLELVGKAFQESIAEMQEAGFFPSRVRVTDGKGQARPDQVNCGSSLPLTEAQRELWLAAQMGEDASRAFVDTLRIHMRGPFRTTSMVKAIQELVARHDSLRSTFSEDGEELRVAASLKLDVSVSDLSGLEETESGTQLAEIAAKQSRAPFNLSRDPLLRAHIVKMNEQHHVLVLTTHHIAVDGWSMGVLLSELGAIYSAHCRNEAVGLPSSSQFVNYARWEKSQRERGETSESETYWLTQFKDLAPVLDLPTDRPRLAVKTYAGARERVVIPTSLCRDLRRIAARKGATLFATLLAGFYVLLQRLTGQHDIVVGIPTAGQLAFDARDLVGHCVNFLPLRSRIDESASFSNYLASIRSLLLDGYEHQNYTYGSLIQKLNILRDASHSPLVSVSFNLDKDGSAPDFADLDVEVSNQPKTAINFDCEINVLEAGDELRVSWDYNTDLFDTDTIRRWLHHYRWLLETVVTNPDQRISELPMLTEAERHQLLVAWNDTRREYPKDKCVHHLVEAQEEKTPHAVAAVFDDQNLTYRDLNARANQLAHYLIKFGVGPETLVGICMERSLDMVVGLLGILKAGGAYVPLDAAYPKERLEYMLQEGRVQILLTQQRLLSILPSDHGAQLLCLDTDWALVAEQVDSNPDNTTTPENVAYVIYTSGSTGKPKGVKISHNAVVNFLSAMQRETGIAANDTLLAGAELSFDIAGLELYLPLTVGARVVLVAREVAWDGVLLAEHLAKSGATMMQATPTTWRMLIEDGWRGGSHLKILCGGETLTPDLASQSPDKKLYAMECVWTYRDHHLVLDL